MDHNGFLECLNCDEWIRVGLNPSPRCIVTSRLGWKLVFDRYSHVGKVPINFVQEDPNETRNTQRRGMWRSPRP